MLEAAPVVLAVPCAYALKFLSLVFFIITVIYTAEVHTPCYGSGFHGVFLGGSNSRVVHVYDAHYANRAWTQRIPIVRYC